MPLQIHEIFLLFIRSYCRRSEKASVLLNNSSWLNSSIGFFWGILQGVSQHLPSKMQPIFGISSIKLSICCCHLVVYYLTKPLWNCVSAIVLQPVFAIVSMTQYVENFNLQIPRNHIFQRSLKIQFRSLKLYFRIGRSSWYNFPFVSLVCSKPKQYA